MNTQKCFHRQCPFDVTDQFSRFEGQRTALQEANRRSQYVTFLLNTLQTPSRLHDSLSKQKGKCSSLFSRITGVSQEGSMISRRSVLSVVVLNFLMSQIILGPAAAGDICNCVAVLSAGKCLSLYPPSVNGDSIATGTEGLPCTERTCGVRYECLSSGTLQCMIRVASFKLTISGTVNQQDVCKLTRPYFTVLVPYDSAQGPAYPVYPISP
jgi:hypothetical protein